MIASKSASIASAITSASVVISSSCATADAALVVERERGTSWVAPAVDPACTPIDTPIGVRPGTMCLFAIEADVSQQVIIEPAQRVELI